MSKLTRLQRAFARSHIDLRYEGGVYTVRNETTEATILLPASLPLEEKAVKQLLAFASVKTPHGDAAVCAACATPDFHPGAIAPVGAVVATPMDVVIPAAIGTDINCGMRLLTTGMSLAQLAPRKSELFARLQAVLLESERNIPTHTSAFKALFDAGPMAFIDKIQPEGLWSSVDRNRLAEEVSRCIGLESLSANSRYAPEAFVSGREVFRDPCLGTPGGGNHFVELQVVDKVLDRHAAYAHGLKAGDVVVMIHSGSRDVGFFVGGRWMDRAREAWPAGVRHPESKLYALAGPMGDASYIARGLGHADWLWSCSHGAGRRIRRQETRGTKPTPTSGADWQCVTLREERLIEEAPQAYKPIGAVIDAQVDAGLIEGVARLRPWVTFKA
ncbi:MAG: hypothetical protein C4K60_03045 [Ideonella sp. MAG2]|nr:MAG: hypothetical protein C4K60_03045 [Ideonella sp. MAG2]